MDHGDHGDMVAVKNIGKSMTNRLTQHDLTIVIEWASFFWGRCNAGSVNCAFSRIFCMLTMFVDLDTADFPQNTRI